MKNFVIEDSQKFTFEASEEKEQDSEVYISNFKKFDFGDSRSLKSKTQEVCFSGANNTNMTDWERGERQMPDYLLRLLAYKVEMEKLLKE